MKLILTADVPNLGGPGDLVEVKDGYGRNLLLPRNLAIVATRGAEKQVASIQRAQKARQIKDLGHAKEVAGQLAALSVTVRSKSAGDSGRLFGSVTTTDIAEAIRAAGGPPVDRRSVDIDGQIKTTGKHEVTVRLHPEVSAAVSVEVVAT